MGPARRAGASHSLARALGYNAFYEPPCLTCRRLPGCGGAALLSLRLLFPVLSRPNPLHIHCNGYSQFRMEEAALIGASESPKIRLSDERQMSTQSRSYDSSQGRSSFSFRFCSFPFLPVSLLGLVRARALTLPCTRGTEGRATTKRRCDARTDDVARALP